MAVCKVYGHNKSLKLASVMAEQDLLLRRSAPGSMANLYYRVPIH